MQEAASFPDWGKVQFIDFPPQSWQDMLPGTSDVEQDVISKLVRYESAERLEAAQVSAFAISCAQEN